MAADECFAVKVLFPGKKKWLFLSGDGANHLRIHASIFKSKPEAESAATSIKELNPGVDAKAVPF